MTPRVPSLSQPRRGSRLLVLVYGVSLVLVLGTAAGLVVVVSDHIRSSAIESSVAADRSLARSFAHETGHSAYLTGPVSVTTTAAVNADLAALIDPVESGIVQLKVYDPDGTVRFSNDGGLVGRGSGIDEGLGAAIANRRAWVEIRPAAGREESTLGRDGNVVEEYLPILDASGTVTSVFEVYRDAAPILDKVTAARDDVLRLAALATLLLSGLLYLIFRAAHRRLGQQTDALLAAEHQDALTGLLDHGAIVASLVEHLESIRTSSAPGAVGVAIVDVDNFRLVNDTHGHAAGDTALREVARILRLELSQASILGRYGPDEFLVIAPPQCAHDLEAAIARLRVRLSDLSLQFGVSERLPVTVSAGICFAPVNGDAATELLSVATVTLGEAKAGGGDGIRVADTGDEPARAFDQSSFGVLQGLVLAVDTKDRYTKRHSEDVARYALFLADRIGLDADLRRPLGVAGLLHDVGKIGTPDTILRKPAALTVEEYEIVKQHVALGDAIVRDVPDVDLVRAAVRHHHERWDGRGYLTGLAGEQIPLFARILSVADAFSAMTTTRPYRKALSVDEAIRRLEDAAESQLDPALVRAFIDGLRMADDPPLPGMDRPMPLIWTPRHKVA